MENNAEEQHDTSRRDLIKKYQSRECIALLSRMQRLGDFTRKNLSKLIKETLPNYGGKVQQVIDKFLRDGIMSKQEHSNAFQDAGSVTYYFAQQGSQILDQKWKELIRVNNVKKILIFLRDYHDKKAVTYPMLMKYLWKESEDKQPTKISQLSNLTNKLQDYGLIKMKDKTYRGLKGSRKKIILTKQGVKVADELLRRLKELLKDLVPEQDESNGAENRSH